MSHFTAICNQNCINICKVCSAHAQYNMQISEKGSVAERHTPARSSASETLQSMWAGKRLEPFHRSVIYISFASHLHPFNLNRVAPVAWEDFCFRRIHLLALVSPDVVMLALACRISRLTLQHGLTCITANNSGSLIRKK